MSRVVLVIEDETVLARNIQRYLTQFGFEVYSAANGASGLVQFDATRPDLVLVDYNLPGMNGIDLLRHISSRDPSVKIIMFTAHGNVQVAVEAMKLGACDYLTKPLALSELKLAVDKALGQERLERHLGYLQAQEPGASGLDKLIGASEPIAALKARIRQLLAAEARHEPAAGPAVLITGESGTGKELVARALHYDSVRRDTPFVEINCASIPSQLVESELFGHERGAFTDAKVSKTGLVESADGGTLFLDEVGELDPNAQAKILRLIENRSMRRVGSVRDRTVDIRVIAATNQPLERMIGEGKFRLDLFSRLRVVSLELPTLRSRGEDVLELAQHFLKILGNRYGRPGLKLSPEANAALKRHDWPGNVRELRNVIEQAVMLGASSEIEAKDLSFFPSRIFAAEKPGTIPSTLPDIERATILDALQRSNQNVTIAARSLGISRDTLRYRMEKFQIRL